MPDLPTPVIAYAIADRRAARRGTHPDPSSLGSYRPSLHGQVALMK
jgi:hypothetical protein